MDGGRRYKERVNAFCDEGGGLGVVQQVLYVYMKDGGDEREKNTGIGFSLDGTNMVLLQGIYDELSTYLCYPYN